MNTGKMRATSAIGAVLAGLIGIMAVLLLLAPMPAYAADYSSAETIEFDKDYTATLTEGSQSSSCWYKFTTTSAGILQLSTTNDQDSDSSVEVYLFESSDVQSQAAFYVDSYEASSTSFTSGRIGLPSDVTYYIEITWSPDTPHTVTLNAKFTQCSDWETERNNYAGAADVISLDTAVNGNNVRCMSGYNSIVGVNDWYKFTAPTSGWVRLTFTSEDSENDMQWDVRFCDEDAATMDTTRRIVDSSADLKVASGTPYASKCYSVTAGKTYYVLVRDSTWNIEEDVGYTLKVESVETQDMYRLYNPNSGEHFYTASADERDSLVNVGWNYEGIGWTAPVTSSTPVYRLYNPNVDPTTGSGEHHYTTSADERDYLVSLGWRYENIGWYSDDAKGVPLYRQYNPNQFNCNHNYTTSTDERDYLVSLGWNDENIGWYGV